VALVTTDVSEESIASIIRVFLRSVLRLLVIANVVSSSLIIFTLMMEVIQFFETSVLTRGERGHIPEDGILLCTTQS
jgi:hypothetical protein